MDIEISERITLSKEKAESWNRRLESTCVSNDLDEVAKQYAKDYLFTAAPTRSLTDHFKSGAMWQKEQMIKDAIDAQVLENYDGKVIRYDETTLDEKLSDCKVFDKVKVIIIKED